MKKKDMRKRIAELEANVSYQSGEITCLRLSLNRVQLISTKYGPVDPSYGPWPNKHFIPGTISWEG